MTYNICIDNAYFEIYEFRYTHYLYIPQQLFLVSNQVQLLIRLVASRDFQKRSVGGPLFLRRTATALAGVLGVEMKPNTLTMRLNVTAGRLFNEYGIRYKNTRSHAGRQIVLRYEPPEA